MTVQQANLAQHHVQGHDRGVDRDRQSQHEQLVHLLPALPDKPRHRVRCHGGSHQRNHDRNNRDDQAVQEIDFHMARVHCPGIVLKYPVLRQANDILAEDLSGCLQGESQHPVHREKADDSPEDQHKIDQYLSNGKLITGGACPADFFDFRKFAHTTFSFLKIILISSAKKKHRRISMTAIVEPMPYRLRRNSRLIIRVLGTSVA